MNEARAVVGMDRLPWLTDEPKPQAVRGARDLLGWAFAGLLVVAGTSYWLGTRVVRPPVESPTPAETLKLPDARETAQPQVPIVEEPQAAAPAAVATQTVEKPVRRVRSVPAARRRTLSPMEKGGGDLARTIEQQEGAPPKPPTAPAAEETKPAPAATARLASRRDLRLWPATESKGASGRLVRVGAFGSREQAKLGWRRMQKAYPAVARLPATVVSDRNSNGKTFYRFQIGTTSQAHSEVLCQRMANLLHFSCAVVGLPWKAKVER
jgi:hypothetical protein